MYVIGIDIGGMSMKWGLVNGQGQVLFNEHVVTIPSESPESNIKRLVVSINSALLQKNIAKNQVKGVGVGCPGIINSKEGIVTEASNLNWEMFHLQQSLETLLDLPVKIGNDANVAALGEVKFGAAKNYHNAIMLTLGTGVGGGVIIDGKTFEGNQGTGAELGHMVIDFNSDVSCTCGRKGCLEAYASASALIRLTKEAMLKDKNSKMWETANNDINQVDGKTAFLTYKQSDDNAAHEVISHYISYLACGIMNFNNIFRPEVFILSGGVAKEGSLLVELLKKECEKYSYGFKLSPIPEILIAKNGYNSGIIGAASLYF